MQGCRAIPHLPRFYLLRSGSPSASSGTTASASHWRFKILLGVLGLVLLLLVVGSAALVHLVVVLLLLDLGE